MLGYLRQKNTDSGCLFGSSKLISIQFRFIITCLTEHRSELFDLHRPIKIRFGINYCIQMHIENIRVGIENKYYTRTW